MKLIKIFIVLLFSFGVCFLILNESKTGAFTNFLDRISKSRISHDGSRTGPRVSYSSYCHPKQGFIIYENEKMPFTKNDGEMVLWTQGDIDCYKQKMLATPTPTSRTMVKNNSSDNIQKLPILNGGKIFELVNSYRASNGKPFFNVSDELCRLAEKRAEYLIQPTYEDFMKNTYPTFKSHPGFQDMTSAFNYSGLGLSENLAMGAKSETDVLNLWKNSPGHNALMLSTEHNGTVYTKACVATRVKYYGSISVLLVGDK